MKYFLLKFVISGKDGVKDDILMIILGQNFGLILLPVF